EVDFPHGNELGGGALCRLRAGWKGLGARGGDDARLRVHAVFHHGADLPGTAHPAELARAGAGAADADAVGRGEHDGVSGVRVVEQCGEDGNGAELAAVLGRALGGGDGDMGVVLVELPRAAGGESSGASGASGAAGDGGAAGGGGVKGWETRYLENVQRPTSDAQSGCRT